MAAGACGTNPPVWVSFSITQNAEISRILRVRNVNLRLRAGFYSVVGLTGMFVLPVLAVLTVGMLACAVIAPVAGVIEFAGGLFGFDVPFVMMQFGRWTMPFWLTLPASLVLGALFLGAAYGLWRALRGYVRVVSRGKSTLDAVKAG